MRLLSLLLALGLCGCEALNQYDRTLAVVGNLNERTGALEYTIRPAARKGEGQLGGSVRIEGNLDSKQVVRLER